MNDAISSQIYTYQERDGQYHMLKHMQALMTVAGKQVIAGYLALAQALIRDLHEFGEGYTDPSSIVTFHYTMLDLIWDVPVEKLMEPLINAIDQHKDWTMDTRYDDIETLGVYYSLFGLCDDKRIAKIQSWIRSLTRTQLCAVLVARDSLSVNLLFNLAEMVAACELDNYKSYLYSFDEFNANAHEPVIDNFLLYYSHDVFGNRLGNTVDDVVGKRSPWPSTYNVNELKARLSFNSNGLAELSELDTAICIATKAHHNQFDKAGKPNILHPLRLMMQLSSEFEMSVAVLHEVVEDSSWSFDDLIAAGISHQVRSTLKLLTHDKITPYLDYIKNLANDPIARRIKILDLKDNMDMARIPNPSDLDTLRLERYRDALIFLTEASGADG